jgi:uncharacterized membrane protein YkvA (DUF1232 family)
MSNETKALLILVATAFYVFTPVDIIPDILPMLGNIDDFLAMYFGIQKVTTLRQSA